jgi:chorismate mutase/prephenate dehydrogenase
MLNYSAHFLYSPDSDAPSGSHTGGGDSEPNEEVFRAELEQLRNKIDQIDSDLVKLLSERHDVVEHVVELKRQHHQPIYHPAREEDLISRRRAQAEENGLSADYVEDVFRAMLRESRKKQTERMVTGQCLKPGANVLLVGGRGAMGQCIGNWFSSAGYNVRNMGSRDWEQIDELTRDIELAIISVPIDRTPDIIERIAPHLPPDCVLTDFTSVKVDPVNAMLAAHKGPVVGLHPVFGPTTSSMDKQIVVVCEGRDPDACQWVVDQMAAWGAIIMESTAEEHDELMAVVQALRHFATFAFGQFLCERDVPLERSLEFSSPIYRLELGMVGRLFAQDSHLYSEIVFATQERREMLQEFIKSVAKNSDMLANNDKDTFLQRFDEISDYFGSFGEQAIRESTFLIEKLIERF